MSNIDNILDKVAEFVKVAVVETRCLRDELQAKSSTNELLTRQLAKDAQEKAEYSRMLKQAADTLYETDFLTDESEKREFRKKAEKDPAYLANVLMKICKSADVALIGSPARVASSGNYGKYDPNDPVARRAFGLDSSSVLDDD